jgi:hypothetical protein
MSGNSMSGAPDKLDEIIQEVAVRHGYVIGRDDPILMTYTINQQLIEAGARIQGAVLEEHLRGMEEISKNLQDQAAAKLDGVLREAMENIRQGMRHETESLFSQQRRQSEALNRLVVESCLQWRRFAIVAMATSILTLLAAVIVLLIAG